MKIFAALSFLLVALLLGGPTAWALIDHGQRQTTAEQHLEKTARLTQPPPPWPPVSSPPREEVELRVLEEKWKAVPDENGVLTRLGQESLQKLGCTPRMISLLQFLNAGENRHHRGIQSIQEAVAAELPGNKVELTLQIAQVPVTDSPFAIRVKSLWCYEAGLNCENEEIDAFCAAIKDGEDFRKEAFVGYAASLARQQPLTGAVLLCDAFKTTKQPSMGLVAIGRFVGSLDPGVDFSLLASLIVQRLPENHALGDLPLSQIDGNIALKVNLLRCWAASSDPDQAYDFIVAHQEALDPHIMKTFLRGISYSRTARIFEKISSLPNGAFRDQTLASWPIVGDAGRAMQLAVKIGEPTLRQETIKRIESSRNATE